jgi:hypothetical protein
MTLCGSKSGAFITSTFEAGHQDVDDYRQDTHERSDCRQFYDGHACGDDPSQAFEQRLASICGSIAAVELKCEATDERRAAAEEQLLEVTQRCSDLPQCIFCTLLCQLVTLPT